MKPLKYIRPQLMARATGDHDAVSWELTDGLTRRRQFDGFDLFCILLAVFCWSLFFASLLSSWGQL